MTRRPRQPLTLHDPAEDAAAPPTSAEGTAEETTAAAPGTPHDLPPPANWLELEPLPEPRPEPRAEARPGPHRPVLSERRRRRLAEEGALRLSPAPEATPPLREMADPTVGAPPARRQEPTLPEPVQTANPPARDATALTPLRSPPAEGRGPGLAATTAALVWTGGVASWLAFEIASGAVEFEPLRVAVYALLAVAPAGLILLIAQALRQSRRLAYEVRRARELAESLTAPTTLAAREAGQVMQSLRADIDQVTLATERARQDLNLLRETLGEETRRLNDTAETAARLAHRLSDKLSAEREAMTGLTANLDRQAAAVVDAVERQSRMIGDASDLAQAQLREAEATLAARAADLAAAAQEAQDAARLASDNLARQTLRLENAGAGVAEQIQSVEEGLGQQRAALVQAAYALRTDQEDFSALVESQRAQLIEQLGQTRTAAADLGDVSQRAGETLRDLVEAAAEQFRGLMEMAARESDEFDAATKMALDKFDALAADARDTLVEETRRALEALKATADDARLAADAAAEQAQIRADRLGEALFESAQKADAAADARLEEARRLAAGAADMVERTGEETVARLESMLERLGQSLEIVRTSVAEVEARSRSLPQDTQAQMRALEQTVDAGLNALAEAARRAQTETDALEAGFQERVRRNYDMLSETVRLMGVVSGETPGARRTPPRPPESLPPLPFSGPPPRRPARPEPEPSRAFGLRGRLSPDGLVPPPAAVGGSLDWSDLEGPSEASLQLDTPVPTPPVSEADLEATQARVGQAIRRMGVDPNALLPRARVEDAAAALARDDADGARQVVRRVAPAAVRSVSRKVLADPELRADVERYVRLLARQLADAARRGDADAVIDRLHSDAGRAFLLLDAAVGDLA
ncbi:MAG: tipN [Brevundimonas sp.]